MSSLVVRYKTGSLGMVTYHFGNMLIETNDCIYSLPIVVYVWHIQKKIQIKYVL